MSPATGLFVVLAAIAIGAALAMLTRKNALDAAVCLVVCFLSFAGLYAMLDAPFVAVMQVLVYAGAIMMLIIFVIMTVDTRDKARPAVAKPVLWGGVAACAIMAACMAVFFMALKNNPPAAQGTATPNTGTVERIGSLIFSSHALNFEMVSLLLLAALIGALVLGKKHSSS